MNVLKKTKNFFKYFVALIFVFVFSHLSDTDDDIKGVGDISLPIADASHSSGGGDSASDTNGGVSGGVDAVGVDAGVAGTSPA